MPLMKEIMNRFVLAVAVVVGVVVVAGCPGSQRRPVRFGERADRPRQPDGSSPQATPTTPAAPPLLVRFEERNITFAVDGQPVDLKATAGLPTTGGEPVGGPVIVIVPGASDVSRKGLRRGDGVSIYPKPVAVTSSWQQAFGDRGALTLAWDKHTCGPNDDPDCNKNLQGDVDKDGPIALSKDVDAACAVARTLPGADGRIVLLAHGQATQVALASGCAKDATAIVLLNPVPRGIDVVLVEGLQARQAALSAEAKNAVTPEDKTRLLDQAVALRNLAATRQAGFASMTSGKFAKDARVDGATISFWLGWIELTAKTPELLAPLQDKTIVVIATGDTQLSDTDRALAKALPAKKTIVVDGDHHFVIDGVLSAGASTAVVDAVVELVVPPAS